MPPPLPLQVGPFCGYLFLGLPNVSSSSSTALKIFNWWVRFVLAAAAAPHEHTCWASTHAPCSCPSFPLPAGTPCPAGPPSCSWSPCWRALRCGLRTRQRRTSTAPRHGQLQAPCAASYRLSGRLTSEPPSFESWSSQTSLRSPPTLLPLAPSSAARRPGPRRLPAVGGARRPLPPLLTTLARPFFLHRLCWWVGLQGAGLPASTSRRGGRQNCRSNREISWAPRPKTCAALLFARRSRSPPPFPLRAASGFTSNLFALFAGQYHQVTSQQDNWMTYIGVGCGAMAAGFIFRRAIRWWPQV